MSDRLNPNVANVGVKLAFHVTGLVLLGTAMRRHADLGDLLGQAAYGWLLAAGCAVVMLGHRESGPAAGRTPAVVLWVVGLAALACLLCPTGIMVASAVAGGALFGLLISGRRRLAGAVTVALTALVCALAATAIGDRLQLVRMPMGPLSWLVSSLLSLAGAEAGTSGSLLVIRGLISDLAFRPTPSTTGLITMLLIAGHWAVMKSSGVASPFVRGGWWRAAVFLVTALAIRFALVVAVGVALESTRDYDDPHFPYEGFFSWPVGLLIDLAAALPAAALSFRPGRSAPVALPVRRLDRFSRWAWAFGIVVGVWLASDRFLDCVGAEKAGRIAVDERHSAWEATDLKLGHDYYGTESGYNFRGLIDWLSLGYGPIRRIYDPIDDALLRDFDVFLIKTPTRTFEPSEIDALERFVAGGGGLILIGDHTNVFGTGTVLNAITSRFDFHFDYDCLFDQRKRYEQVYRREEEVRHHPITRTLDLVRFEVGCSIDIDGPDVRPIIVGRGLKSQPIDYRIANFYPKPKDASQLNTGQFPQLVVRSHGRGRVVAVADSTLFSTFSVFIPGRRELIEGMIAYANRRDVGEPLRLVLRRGGWLALLALLALLRGRGLLAAAVCGIAVLGAMELTTAVGECWVYSGHSESQPGAASREVYFYRGSETVDWPVERFIERHEDTYDLFFQYVSRTGNFPRLVDDLDEVVRRDAPIVLIDPSVPDRDKAVADLVEFVDRGGSLILMESRPNELVSELAGRAGLSLTPAAASASVARIVTPYGEITDRSWVTRPSRGIAHGSPMLFEEQADGTGEGKHVAVAAVAALGRGHVAVITCGGRFANANFGYSYSMVPSQEQRRLFEFGFDVIHAAAGTAPQ